jgi:asparagine synthetase B (glutamine-hydrolysing)
MTLDARPDGKSGDFASRATPCLTVSVQANLRRIMEIETPIPLDSALVDREADLAAWLVARGPVAVGFSGGVDSAYLAVAARRAL